MGLQGAKATSKRMTGAANFVAAEGKVKFTFLPKEGNDKYPQPTFMGGKTSMTFDAKELPVQLPNETEDVVVITTNGDGDKIEVIAPFEGTYTAKFVSFSRPNGEGTAPIWTEEQRTFSEGGKSREYTVLKFTAYFELTKHRLFKGVKIPFFLRYMFQDRGDGKAGWAFVTQNGKAKKSVNGQKLMDFCERLNCVNEDIVWPEDGNILPELEKRALAFGKPVKVVLSGGWMSDFTRVSTFSEEDEAPKEKEELMKELGYEEEKPAPKKKMVVSDEEM
jgi:hypothetical protein